MKTIGGDPLGHRHRAPRYWFQVWDEPTQRWQLRARLWTLTQTSEWKDRYRGKRIRVWDVPNKQWLFDTSVEGEL